ncbi:DNA ligase (NAD(+)) LigA [Mycoplasmopsis bovirhinis]|uniref:NAD-dependent DNA ligase LigA n=1 Tax=Mycoplasmopsis bovirhinis TaxID=29553 RepID=UPI000BB9E306|nr:NAD-dependent DNA ligase LigA [Mycoplasmopsis bovirhinis]BBA22238.1 DNA ligase (NAD(+)) LigA [Mycoplasmopsis bovirhinis]
MNSNNNIEQKIKELTKNINKWNKEYYDLSSPSVSDAKYDLEIRKLEILEQEYPQFIQKDSPTKKVGGKVVPSLKEFSHNKPMLSLAKAHSENDILKFIQNTQNNINKTVTYSLEPKIDGVSISLHYNDGILVRAVTRGTGLVGSDVTHNIKEIQNIPKFLNYKQDLEVRGEIYFPKSEFNKLNQERLANNEKLFANPRNAASGSIQQLDSANLKNRNLLSIIYDIVDPNKLNLKLQTDVIAKLKELSFAVNPYVKEGKNFEDIWSSILEFKKNKDSFDYESDGFVLKVNQLDLWDLYGQTAKFPKHAIAFKFETEEKNSIIKNIIPTVGRSGKISYIAEINPINLLQTTVQRATLHNADFIKNMNINIGDEVSIIKSGEIIPKITGIKNKNTKGYYQKNLNCPSCGYKLIHLNNLVDQFCINKTCKEKLKKQLMHFVSKNALDIETLAEKNIEFLFNKGLLSDFLSLFNLHNYRSLILSYEGFKETKVDKIINAIQESRIKTPFYKVFYGLGIKHVGLKVAQLLSGKLNNFKEFLSIDLSELESINTIGPAIIKELDIYRKENKQLLIQLDNVFSYLNKMEKDTQKLLGLTFAITGKLANPRSYYQKLILDNGGQFSASINKNLSYLITNESSSSSKYIKATELGVKIITELEFLELLK